MAHRNIAKNRDLDRGVTGMPHTELLLYQEEDGSVPAYSGDVDHRFRACRPAGSERSDAGVENIALLVGMGQRGGSFAA